MAYTPATDTGSDGYTIVVQHITSGIIIEVTLAAIADGKPIPTRAVKDAVMQGALDKLAAIPGCSILAARRSINFTSDITPTP